MRHALTALAFLAGITGFCGVADANVEDASANPYQAIIERNVFGLKPPPPPPTKDEKEKSPPPKIFLTGISTMFGKPIALLKTPPPPGPVKPGEPPKTDRFYMLSPGQRDGDLAVEEIDEKAGVVKVTYSGTPFSLNWEENGAKLVASAAMPMPGVVQPGLPAPHGFVPQGQPTQTAPGMPVRPLRMPTTSGYATPTSTSTYRGATATPTYNSGITTPGLAVATPGGTVGVPINQTVPNPTPQAAAQNQIPVENQWIMVEAERERTRSAVTSGRLPPLPPTPLTPAGSPGSIAPAPEQNAGPGVTRSLPPRLPGMPAPIPQ